MALSTDLKSYWKMDEISGTRVDAVSGFNFTDNFTVGSTTGIINLAGDYNVANTEFLSVASNPDLQAGDVNWWANMWIFLQSGPPNVHIFQSKRNSAANREYLIGQTSPSGLWFMTVYGASGVVGTVLSGSAPSLNAFHMLSVWQDAAISTIFMSIDGGATTSAVLIGNAHTQSAPVRMGAGCSPENSFMDGRIDEVGWWKRIPLLSEITELYNSGLGLPFSSFGAAAGVTAGGSFTTGII